MYIVFFQMPAVVEICPDISSRGGGGGGGVGWEGESSTPLNPSPQQIKCTHFNNIYIWLIINSTFVIR